MKKQSPKNKVGGEYSHLVGQSLFKIVPEGPDSFKALGEEEEEEDYDEVEVDEDQLPEHSGEEEEEGDMEEEEGDEEDVDGDEEDQYEDEDMDEGSDGEQNSYPEEAD